MDALDVARLALIPIKGALRQSPVDVANSMSALEAALEQARAERDALRARLDAVRTGPLA